MDDPIRCEFLGGLLEEDVIAMTTLQTKMQGGYTALTLGEIGLFRVFLKSMGGTCDACSESIVSLNDGKWYNCILNPANKERIDQLSVLQNKTVFMNVDLCPDCYGQLTDDEKSEFKDYNWKMFFEWVDGLTNDQILDIVRENVKSVQQAKGC